MAINEEMFNYSTTDYDSQITVFSNNTKTLKDDFCDGHEDQVLDKVIDEVLKQILIVFGIFINSIAIWILVSQKRMQNMFLHLLACSLVADNGFLVMALITTMYYEFKVKQLAGIVSYMSIPFKEIFFTGNVLITMSMAYERYTTLDVGKGYRTRMKVKALRYQRLKKYILFFCVVCPLVNLHDFFSHDERAKRTDLWKSSEYRWFIQFKWLIILGISTIILLFLNYKVFAHVTKTMEMTRQDDILTEKTITINGKSVKKSGTKKHKFFDKMKRHEKLSFALFGIVFKKFLCNSFFIIELSLKIVIKDGCSPSYQKNFEIIVRLMRILNAISNALVYCIADRTFRRHLRFYLKRIFYPLFCKMIPILEPKTVEEESSTHHKSQQFGDNTPLTRTPLHTPLTARRFQSSIQDLRRGSNLSVEFKRPQTNTLSP